MSQDIDQSINQDGGQQLTEVANELRTKTLLSNFKITEGARPGDRFYEMRHYRASMVRWQEDGSVLIVARSSELTPNEGYLDVKSTGYMHFKSDHNIKIAAEGHASTGGGEAGSDEEKSVEIFGTGDITIQSNGKGGVVINAAKDIELISGGTIKLNAAEQVSINTGSQDVLPGIGLGLGQQGSGTFSISTGSYSLSTNDFTEVVTGSKSEENYGEVLQKQKINPTDPTLPTQHLTTTNTVGSLVHKVGGDYILDVSGKMYVKVMNLPPNNVLGPLTTGVGGYGVLGAHETLKYTVMGGRTSEILIGATNPTFSQDYVHIPLGNHFIQVDKAAPGLTGVSAGTITQGAIVYASMAQGHIALMAGPSPLNAVLIENLGGSILIDALGVKGMIHMLATVEIAGVAPIIRLN